MKQYLKKVESQRRSTNHLKWKNKKKVNQLLKNKNKSKNQKRLL